MSDSSVLLLRHPEVARAWAGRCYGRSDMGLSRAGMRTAAALVTQLSAERVDRVIHSGAQRTRRLAEPIARRLGCAIAEDRRWSERDFGSWEGRRWNAIWRETGDLMDRIMTDPDHFRPGGGETGRDLFDRARAAWDALPQDGVTLVVTHGGPIAAIRTWQCAEPLEAMIAQVPPTATLLRLPRQPQRDEG